MVTLLNEREREKKIISAQQRSGHWPAHFFFVRLFVSFVLCCYFTIKHQQNTYKPTSRHTQSDGELHAKHFGWLCNNNNRCANMYGGGTTTPKSPIGFLGHSERQRKTQARIAKRS